MTDIQAENYWSSHFEITQDDLSRVAEGLEHEETPQELKAIALRIVRGHLEHAAEAGNEPAESILFKQGERILSRLADALQSDSRFTGLEGKWFLAEKLPPIERAVLQKVHGLLLQNPSLPVDEILSVLKENLSTDQTLWKMALQTALSRSPERFENIGTPAQPQWKARLPEIDQAEVTHYAY